MSQQQTPARRRRWFSLSVRVTILLVLAAIIPLLSTIIYSAYYSRPALVKQANQAMQTDINNRVQLVDEYLKERLSDATTISSVQSILEFYAPHPSATLADQQSLVEHAIFGLKAGEQHDKYYSNWTLFDLNGKVLLSFPPKTTTMRGGSFIPKQYIQRGLTGQAFISDVYYNPKTKASEVDMYAPVKLPTPENPIPNLVVGFMRSTLNLGYVSNIINSEVGANGSGSYAFILDQYGVRIADPNPDNLFTAIAPLSGAGQKVFKSENRMGNGTPTAKVLADTALNDNLSKPHPDSQFQITPAGKNEDFDIVRVSNKIVPWNYFVLSPANTVTAVVDQQLNTTILIGAIVLIFMLLVGLAVGRRTTQPIMSSVENLLGSTEALNTLANRQQKAASEQMWVVDSSQVGLQSVQYYTEATNVAANRLLEVTNDLVQNWNRLDQRTILQSLEQIITTAKYIQNASDFQNTSNQKLATAIKVTTQVTEQLATGATSASSAATQLEGVVEQLRQVVGR